MVLVDRTQAPAQQLLAVSKERRSAEPQVYASLRTALECVDHFEKEARRFPGIERVDQHSLHVKPTRLRFAFARSWFILLMPDLMLPIC
jgi:hypothetical protein